MKYLKMLGLAAVAAAALMAFTGSASATTLTCGGGVTCSTGTTIHAELATGVAKLTNSFGVPIECSKSTIQGKTTNTGSLTETVKGTVDILTWGAAADCNCEVKTLKTGTLEIHTEFETTGNPATSHQKATSDGNGTLTASGQEVTTVCSTIFGPVHCIWSTSNTDLGTLTGGTPATLQANTTITRTGGSSACGSTGTWTAHYKVTSPATLLVH